MNGIHKFHLDCLFSNFKKLFTRKYVNPSSSRCCKVHHNHSSIKAAIKFDNVRFLHSNCNFEHKDQNVSEHSQVHLQLLDKVKAAVNSNGNEIREWLRTNKAVHARHLDSDVVEVFKNAEHFASLHGLLLCDVSLDNLKKHVFAVEHLRDLFSPVFIREQKSILYGECRLPLLKPKLHEPGFQAGLQSQITTELPVTAKLEQRDLDVINDNLFKDSDNALPHDDESSCRLQFKDDLSEQMEGDRFTNVVSYKRQMLIERLSFAEALQSAREEASNLMELQKPSELPALTATCQQWISDIADFIKADRERGGDTCLPPQLDETTLATATVRMALQLMCFPAYALDSRGQRGGLMRRRSQQTAGNQVLLAHAAVRLGDEIGRIYARKAASNLTDDAITSDGDTTKSTLSVSSTSSRIGTGIVPFIASALSGASQARVISNVAGTLEDGVAHTDGACVEDHKHWNSRQSASIGGYLLNALVKSCFIEVDLATALRQANLAIPSERSQQKQRYWLSNMFSKPRFDEAKVQIAAFGHRVLRDGVKTYGVLEMKECCMLKLRDAVARGLVVLSCLPMVCEPKPWTSVSNGGLTVLRHYFIRTHTRPTFDVRVHDISGILDTVTKFGKVPWRINNRVLSILRHLWHNSTGLPIMSCLPTKDVDAGKTTMERANLMSECSLFERRLRIAEDFSAEPCIYFPQNIDFRGRMYPLSPHLNHMADDVCRGLLHFARSKPLGERGFFWLQVHVANLYGIDKVSFQERLAWIKNNYNLLKLLVHKPTDQVSQSFWQRAESPFQLYAAAFELVEAIESGNPTAYQSRIPIQQDGSCNGLQHYAALGRDLKGGIAVNLMPGDSPQDVYQEVLHQVISKVREDYEHATGSRAKWARVCLENGLLKRKIVKQTVMTICYGVTRLGAVAQIEQRLKELTHLEIVAEAHNQLAQYIASQVLGSIKTVFGDAMAIKRWLDGISSAHNRLNVPVVWISPIGLPCEQPYCKSVTKVVRTPIQAINIAEHAISCVDKRKQKLAFPPNFVHSLDASHLMLTAQRIFAKGFDFVAVHDSYWTHATNVDEMNVEIRETFVNMYQDPILENLYETCQKRLQGQVIIEAPPKRGQLDLDLVRQSRYFFH
ncbi:bifunctional DNA-directed RNA polymerase [Babesia duncani]|uniref:DNA-directed RNA polymerase n=1 Tax=Babesia duncani TaxID=323732 RepID=A0AAD9UPI1_9APIC|nr:bifunctional DNA-directed RNA polymerase [Babesia duncani]